MCTGDHSLVRRSQMNKIIWQVLFVSMFPRVDVLLGFETCHRHHIRYKYNHDTLLEDCWPVHKGYQDCNSNRHGINEVCVPCDNVCAAQILQSARVTFLGAASVDY